jgi:hypothetical protein
LGHADPGEESVQANAHARGRTADQLAELLDDQLVAAGVLRRDPDGPRNAALLVGALQRRATDGVRPPVLVVDGLDEARGEAFPVARELLSPLARFVTLVVATRNPPDPAPRGGVPTNLIDELGPGQLLDLDEPVWAESGRSAIGRYLEARLAGVDPVMDAAVVAGHLQDSVGLGDQPFLLARMVADQLVAHPLDTGDPGWVARVPDSIGAALTAGIEQVSNPDRGLPDGVTPAGFARTLLNALTWGFGSGLPEAEWITVATALAEAGDRGPGAVTAGDVTWVLDQLGRYIIQDAEAGTAVFRVAHQSLVDHLHPRFRPTPETLFDPAALPVAQALAARYQDLLASGAPPQSPHYLWSYLRRHAAQAGPAGLAELSALAQATPELRPALLYARNDVAGSYREAGAVQRAIELYRRNCEDGEQLLGPDHPDTLTFRNDLAGAYRAAGDLGRAIPLFEATLADRLRVLGPDHPDTLTSRNNLAYASAIASLADSLQLGARIRAAGADPGDAGAVVRFAVTREDEPDRIAALVGACGLHDRHDVAALAESALPADDTVVRAFCALVGSGYDPWRVRHWWAEQSAALFAAANAVDEDDPEDLRCLLDLNAELGGSGDGDALRVLAAQPGEPLTLTHPVAEVADALERLDRRARISPETRARANALASWLRGGR